MSLSSAPRNSGVVAARKTAWKGPIATRGRSTMATTAALLLSHGKCAHRGKRGHGSSPTIAAIVSWLREEPVGSGKPTAEAAPAGSARIKRSEEHTSELKSLMRISYAVFCLKTKKIKKP